MKQVLYRKYRSQTFSEILGQDSITKVLTESIKQGNIAHAYLFTGPRGTGKTSMARILAKALNCTKRKNADPCNKCENCKNINNNSFLDLIEIDAASNRGIDEIRDLKEKVGFLPVEGTYKVYIIDEVHMLTSEAFNALLKTLEEPPDNVVFILATTEAHKLPATVISRTQRLDFKLASSKQLKNKLKYILKKEEIIYDEGALETIINTAGGSFRDAESILEKVLSSSGYKKDKELNSEDVSKVLGLAKSEYIVELIDLIVDGNIKEAIESVQSMSREGVDFNQVLKQLLFKLRQELIDNVKGGKSKYKIKDLYVFIKAFNEALDQMRNAVVVTLPIEMAILSVSDINGKDTYISTVKISSPEKSSDSKKVESVNKEAVVTKKASIIDSKKSKKLTSIEGVSVDNSSLDEDIELDTTVVNLDFEIIQNNWSDLINASKEANSHLAAILIKLKLVDYEEGKLFVEVPFTFHQKQLQNTKTSKSLQKLFNQIYGATITFEIAINSELAKIEVDEAEPESNVSMIDEVFADLV